MGTKCAAIRKLRPHGRFGPKTKMKLLERRTVEKGDAKRVVGNHKPVLPRVDGDLCVFGACKGASGVDADEPRSINAHNGKSFGALGTYFVRKHGGENG